MHRKQKKIKACDLKLKFVLILKSTYRHLRGMNISLKRGWSLLEEISLYGSYSIHKTSNKRNMSLYLYCISDIYEVLLYIYSNSFKSDLISASRCGKIRLYIKLWKKLVSPIDKCIMLKGVSSYQMLTTSIIETVVSSDERYALAPTRLLTYSTSFISFGKLYLMGWTHSWRDVTSQTWSVWLMATTSA